jgi:hypothetical protein
MKIRKGVNQSNKIGLSKIKIQKLEWFYESNGPSPKMLEK